VFARQAPSMRDRLLLDDGPGSARSRNAVCPLMADKRRACD
jgi:hypothetical protein